MQMTFYKYQATGNDFIMVDNRQEFFSKNDTKTISRLCHRRFGVGADGLILLETDNSTDFRMVYFNADGKQGSMCGNGGRCIVAFARFLDLIGGECTFQAVDGIHQARISKDQVALQMQDVTRIQSNPRYLFLDTGSPHHVQFWEDWDALDVEKEGRRIRYGLYGEKGSNINFVNPLDSNRFQMRTYERGVEAETYSCGTGATAVALAMHELGRLSHPEVVLDTLGGTLKVRFKKVENGFSDIWLEGPAERVFKGVLK
ncbi:MAG: diaminopimelate epimerase [Robiginitalea sp.]|uniref:diaminopimelate epimerase n=1 Tax=Robiginitalea sp. TaxID=1902411 RepID=UPI003C790544